MGVLDSMYDVWWDMMNNKSDQRTTNWPLMSSPLPTAAICLTYVYCVKVIGPKLMEDRKPFKLKEILIVYNLLQVVWSAYIFYEICMSGWMIGYSYRCQQIDRSRSPQAMRMASVSWWYFFTKFTEFFDTLFFIMRKRFNQVSTLHIIHHGLMPFSVWWGVKFFPGGHATFFGMLNTGVHVVMYTYYMLAAMGPAVQKYLWWKKYLTMFQIAQFTAIFAHSFQLLFSNPCNFSTAIIYYIGLHGALFFGLFSKFYARSYSKKVGDEKRLPDEQVINQKDETDFHENLSSMLYENIEYSDISYKLKNKGALIQSKG